MPFLKITSNPFQDLYEQWRDLDPETAYRDAIEGTAESFLDELKRRVEETDSTDWTEVIEAADVWAEPAAVVVGFEAGTDHDDRAFELEYGTETRPPVSVFRTAQNSFDFESSFGDRLYSSLFGGE